MEGLGRGLSLDEVGRKLGVSENTASTYAKRAYRKLRAGSRVEAVLLHRRVHRFCDGEPIARAQ